MRVHWLEQTAADVPPDNAWLAAGERVHLSGLRFPKRRSDWRLGRWTAKQAVAACLNLPRQTLADIEIRSAQSGAPQVFLQNEAAAVSISISHRADVAACAVAPSGAMLGCDLELIEPRSAAFLADYFTAEEQELVARAPTADSDRVANLVWSAKESALKALGEGLRLDSRCVVVGLLQNRGHVDFLENPTAGSQAQAGGWHSLQVAYTDGRVFHGWWQHTGSFLRTMVASPPPTPPVILTVAGR